MRSSSLGSRSGCPCISEWWDLCKGASPECIRVWRCRCCLSSCRVYFYPYYFYRLVSFFQAKKAHQPQQTCLPEISWVKYQTTGSTLNLPQWRPSSSLKHSSNLSPKCFHRSKRVSHQNQGAEIICLLSYNREKGKCCETCHAKTL